MANGHNGHNGNTKRKGIYERYEGNKLKTYERHSAMAGDKREEQKRKKFKKKDYGLYLGD